MKTLLSTHTILVLVLTLSTAFGQATPATQPASSAISIAINPNSQMYSQISNYQYAPSTRDPFISSLILSPIVIDDEFIDSAISVDREKIRAVITSLQEYIKERIQILGISSSRLDMGYALASIDAGANLQVIKPGHFLLLPFTDETDVGVIQSAIQLAADAGEAINLNVYESGAEAGLSVPIRSIKENRIEFDTPITSRNIQDTGTITIMYEKTLLKKPIDPSPR